MKRRRIKAIVGIIVILMVGSGVVRAQKGQTGIQGRVVDEVTGETLPFVQVGFQGGRAGTTTDMDGNFRLISEGNDSVVLFRMMGYEGKEMKLQSGVVLKVKIEMTPQSKTLGSVTVVAKKGKKTRYRRRNNPAVELVERTIENKNKMRPESRERYRRDVYEKFILSLDDFHPDFVNKRMWRKFSFLEKYIDETPFDATKILTVSLKETMMEQTYRRKPRQMRTLTKARRMEGLEELLGREGIDEDIAAMFRPVDLFENDIEIMLNHFISPLSSTLATTFYKYYITDTTEVEGQRCVVLSFVPAAKESYGFTGQLYIALDSNRSLLHYEMTVSPHVNLNFVRDLTIVQSYSVNENGVCMPTRSDTYARLYIHKRLQELYAQQTRMCTNYDFSPDVVLLPDSLFSPLSNEATLRNAKKMRRKEWNARRPIVLSSKETMIDSLKTELSRLPEFEFAKSVSEMIVGGYVTTSTKREKSYVDIGPVLSLASYNREEGWRARIGWQTTALLSDRNFGDFYVGYGFGDKRWKYGASYIHTFNDKEHHYLESPRSYFSVSTSYDLENPGQNFDDYARDNILNSTRRVRRVQYVRQANVRLRKEWASHLSADTWVVVREVTPAGGLAYEQIHADGSTSEVECYRQIEWQGKLTFNPNQKSDNRRNKGGMIGLEKSAPKIGLCHRIGYMEGGFLYQRTDLSAQKNFWLSSFGYIDGRIESGVVWSQTPSPLLYTPSTGTGIFLSSNSFMTMQPMEFVMDHYVSLYATYHLKGLILRHIPLVKRLKWREVVSFKMLYGGLTPRNDVTGFMSGVSPAQYWEGLYTLPEKTQPLGSTPYMEWGVGLENIFKFIRIDYIRRLSYLEAIEKKDRGMFRIQFKFTL